MKYGKILGKAWEILWKYKQLWPFGLIASAFSGISYLVPYTQSNLIRDITNQSNADQTLLALLTYLFIFLLFALLTFLISLFGTTGSILGNLHIQAKRKVAFRQLAGEGWRFYGRALKLNMVLTTLPILVPIIFVILAALVTFITAGLGIFCVFPLIFLIIPFGFLYYIYVEVANVMLLSEELDYRSAISHSWRLFKANWGSLAILGFDCVGGHRIAGICDQPTNVLHVLSHRSKRTFFQCKHSSVGHIYSTNYNFLLHCAHVHS